MSLLNLNSFDNGNEQLGGELVDFVRQKEDMSNIFDEIEQLLRRDECIANAGKECATTTSAAVQVALPAIVSQERAKVAQQNFDINSNSSDVTLDFLPSYPAHDFLLREDAHNFHEDPLLFSVNQNELQPITSPFMVPGIYKKIATTPIAATFACGSDTAEADNVFISQREPSGRIVSRNDFRKLYEGGSEPHEVELPPQENVTHQNNNELANKMEASDKNSKHWEALSKLACNIFKFSNSDHIVIDRKLNQVVRTRDGTNQKTIYRFLEPEALGLTAHNDQTNKSPTNVLNNQPTKQKLGRPKKRTLDNSDTGALPLTPKQKRIEESTKAQKQKSIAESTIQPQLRTRSGRVVKLVKPLAVGKNAANDSVEPAELHADYLPESLVDLKDADYVCSRAIVPPKSAANEIEAPPPLATSSPIKRRVPPGSTCPTCKKIFLGKRLQRHFAQHPDHMQPLQIGQQEPPQPEVINECAQEQQAEELTLFRFLIAKLQKSNLNEDQRADLFLHELNDLIEQLQLRSSRLIRNTSGLHFVTARTARVLGIPEGQYALDMSAIEAPPELDSICIGNYEQKNIISMPPMASVNTRSLDYTALSLDDTLTDEAAQKLNLSAGGKLLPPSEESLLRAVGDLVHEDMTKLVATTLLHPPVNGVQSAGGSTLVPHYDNASDNAVEAMTMKETNIAPQPTPLLDLTVDLFQFKNN